jgi:hypothetical protein
MSAGGDAGLKRYASALISGIVVSAKGPSPVIEPRCVPDQCMIRRLWSSSMAAIYAAAPYCVITAGDGLSEVGCKCNFILFERTDLDGILKTT